MVSRCAWCGPTAPILDYKLCGWADIGLTSHGMCGVCVAIQMARFERLVADQQREDAKAFARPVFSTVSGRDFGRSIAWARRTTSPLKAKIAAEKFLRGISQ